MTAATTTTPPSPEQLAGSLLATLVEQLGAEVVSALVAIATGEDTISSAIEPLSLLAMSVVRGVLGVLEPAAVRALVTAGYAAADAQADVAENLKFPKG